MIELEDIFCWHGPAQAYCRPQEVAYKQHLKTIEMKVQVLLVSCIQSF